jgi:hypothetical protein
MLLCALAGLLLPAAASAKRIAPPSIVDRVARADCIVVGKVTSIEDRTVKTPTTGELGIAIVKIESGLLGVKGLTHVKVGFRPGSLMTGQEACFFLTRVAGQTYYTANGFFDILLKDRPGGYAQEVEAVKRCAALLDEPMKGLKSKEAAERILTASLLICRYRTARLGAEKQALIDANESKLILQALAEGDWNKFDPVLRFQTSAVFFRLGLTEADGFKQPADFQQLEQTAKEWLKTNAGKYRIKRFVSDQQ